MRKQPQSAKGKEHARIFLEKFKHRYPDWEIDYTYRENFTPHYLFTARLPGPELVIRLVGMGPIEASFKVDRLNEAWAFNTHRLSNAYLPNGKKGPLYKAINLRVIAFARTWMSIDAERARLMLRSILKYV